MIHTRAQAEALHSAIEARDDAWNRFHNAALMPANQTPDERLVAAANNWIAATTLVAELSHGLGLVPTDGLPEPGADSEGASSAGATVKSPAKRRGRPPKAKAAAASVPAGDGRRTEEEIRAAAAGAAGPAEATDADAGGDGAAA